MKERILESVHIEKTAGTSVMGFFEKVLGRDHVAFYDPTTDSLTRSSDLLLPVSSRAIDVFKFRFQPFWPLLKKMWVSTQSRKRYSEEIPEGIMVIHGHFRADRFDAVVADPLRAVLIREPLARMRSQYDHWKATKGLAEWRVRTPFNPDMVFEEFAMLPQLQNYQTQALADKDLAEFSVVGVMENLEAYSSGLQDVLVNEGFCQKPNQSISIEVINRTPSRLRSFISEIDPNFKEAFREFHKRDYQLYNKALTRSII